jgi:hypothetical protein
MNTIKIGITYDISEELSSVYIGNRCVEQNGRLEILFLLFSRQAMLVFFLSKAPPPYSFLYS